MIKLPQYLSANDRTVSVVGMVRLHPDQEPDTVWDGASPVSPEELEDGKGYIDENGKIWIFSSLGKPKNANQYPYFWKNPTEEGEEVTFSHSEPQEDVLENFDVYHIKDISLVSIIENTQDNEVLYDEKEINDMNAAASIYVPTISETDDFLKKVVKWAIIQKGIDINRLKGKIPEKYQLLNMKAALQGSTKMSVLYFMSWMNLLGLDFNITISDSGEDTLNPLKDPLIYQSDRDNVSMLRDGVLVDIDTGKYNKEEGDEEDE